MIKIGIAGTGNTAKTHIRRILETGRFQIVGFTGTNVIEARAIIKEFNLPFFSSVQDLSKVSQAIDFASPEYCTFSYVKQVIKLSRHVFVQFPYLLAKDDLKSLSGLLTEADVIGQCGSSEKFNPAYTVAKPIITNPTFIDAARLVQHAGQSHPISVVYDLMIKDIDIALSLIKSNVKKVSANAVSIFGDEADMISARIEFDNGSMVNLTAGKVSETNIRKTRVYQNQAYVFIDFYDKWVKHSNKNSEQLDFEEVPVVKTNETLSQFNSFYSAIQCGTDPVHPLEHAVSALEVAEMISDKIKLRTHLKTV